MIFRHFLTASNESNAFIVACGQTREAMLIDAGTFEDEMAEFLDTHGLKLAALFITHDHYDHVGGVDEVVRRYNPRVYAARTNPGGAKATALAHGDTVRVGTLEGRVLAVPGHTPDMLCLHFPGMVFTGDALFAGSVGGTSSPDEAQRQIRGIREHIFTLPPDTLLHTGHGPSSTVAVESRYNPFFV